MLCRIATGEAAGEAGISTPVGVSGAGQDAGGACGFRWGQMPILAFTTLSFTMSSGRVPLSFTMVGLRALVLHDVVGLRALVPHVVVGLRALVLHAVVGQGALVLHVVVGQGALVLHDVVGQVPLSFTMSSGRVPLSLSFTMSGLQGALVRLGLRDLLALQVEHGLLVVLADGGALAELLAQQGLSVKMMARAKMATVCATVPTWLRQICSCLLLSAPA